MKRVYVAGRYNGDSAADMLRNIGTGVLTCKTLIAQGVAPFCPWLDCLYAIQIGVPLMDEDFQAVTLEWLKASDAVLMLKDWERSKGARREKDEAQRLGIPVFFSMQALFEWIQEERDGE